MKILPLLVGLGFAALLPATAPCAAPLCSCREPAAAGEAAEGASAVFSGVVLSVADDAHPDGYWERRVAVRVSSAWKGPTADTLVVLTGIGGGDCGFPFEVGRAYLVFATSEDDALFTGICTRTRPLEDAAADVALLGTPARTVPPSR